MHRYEIAAAIVDQGVIGIVRSPDQASARSTAESLLAAGLRVVEVTLTTPGALDLVTELSAGTDRLVGVGTVLDETSVRLAALAGARFVVSPTLRPDVVGAARRYGMVAVPGVTTPTEALGALEAGADLIKVFPASAYGPGGVRDILTALPQLPLVPTGGVTLDDAADYVRAGAVAVGMGSALSSGSADEAHARVDALLARIDAARR